MSDEVIDFLGEIYVNNNIGRFRKITFYQFLEAATKEPKTIENLIRLERYFLNGINY
jgi:hypothetical protein